MSSNLETYLENPSTNSYKDESTPIIFFERIVLVVEQSYEVSTLNGWTSSRREYEEEISSRKIFGKMRRKSKWIIHSEIQHKGWISKGHLW